MSITLLLAPAVYIFAKWFQRQEAEKAEREILDNIKRQNDARHFEESERKRLITIADDMRRADQESERAKGEIRRKAFFNNLVLVSDCVNHIKIQHDKNSVAYTTQEISELLKDIVSPYTIDQLIFIVKSDKAISIALSSMLASLDVIEFHSPSVDVLKSALGSAGR